MQRISLLILGLVAYSYGQCTIQCYGACHTAVTQCTPPSTACQDVNAPFYCPSTSSCVSNIDTCKNSSADCTLVTDVKCWDGSCANTFGLCKPVPSCPPLFKRCGTGCIDERNQCNAPACTGTLCADGHCALDGICSPFNGCTSPNAIECADDICSSSLAACSSCSNGVTCWDGSCEETNSLCKSAPGAVKPKEFSIQLDSAVATDFNIVDFNNEILCKINVPAGVFSASTRIQVTGVADSVLRSATLSEWSQEDHPMHNLLSSAFDLSFVVDFEEDIVGEFNIACIPSFRGELTARDTCLGYINPAGNWVCEVTELASEIFGDVLYLGARTNHLGTFAIIRHDKPDPEDSSTGGGSLVVIIIVVVVVVLLLAIVGGILAWFFLVKKKGTSEEEQARKSWSSPVSSDDD